MMNAVVAEEMIERTGRALIDAAPAPAKVILFGSYARGDADEGSDFDFLVIEEKVRDRLAEAVGLRRALGDFDAPVDLIVLDALAERRAKVPGTMVDRALREELVVAEFRADRVCRDAQAPDGGRPVGLPISATTSRSHSTAPPRWRWPRERHPLSSGAPRRLTPNFR